MQHFTLKLDKPLEFLDLQRSGISQDGTITFITTPVGTAFDKPALGIHFRISGEIAPVFATLPVTAFLPLADILRRHYNLP